MAEERVQVNYRSTAEIKQWLDQEARDSGRSVQFMIDQAVMQWHRRLTRERARRAAARAERLKRQK